MTAGACDSLNQHCSLADSVTALKCGEITLHSFPVKQLFVPGKHSFRHVVTVNAEIFVYSHTHQMLNEIMKTTVNTIDGRVLQWLCKLLYPRAQILRLNGANFIFDLAAHCMLRSESLFLLGSTELANSLARQKLQSLYPGLRVSGFSPKFQPYPFGSAWNEEILKKISGCKPDHVVVCFGPIKQEYWIHQNSYQLAGLGVRCAYGLGGTIDFISGSKPRAPKWVEFIGTEWLFRLICEPKARFGRTLTMLRMPFYVGQTARHVEKMHHSRLDRELIPEAVKRS